MAESIGVTRGGEDSLDLTTVAGVLTYYTQLAIDGMKEELEKIKSNGLNSIASYELYQSIRPNFEVETTKFGIKYTAQIFMEDYWQAVDEGRKAGKQPPVDVIVNWIRNKEGFKLRGMDKLGDIRERGKNKRKPYTIEELRRGNAIGIARKIGLHGTKGNRFVSNVVNQAWYDGLTKDLSKALNKDVEINVKIMVDEINKLATGENRFQ